MTAIGLQGAQEYHSTLLIILQKISHMMNGLALETEAETLYYELFDVEQRVAVLKNDVEATYIGVTPISSSVSE